MLTRFKGGEIVFDKWYSTEYEIKKIDNFKAVLESTNPNKILIIEESMLRDSDRFIKLQRKGGQYEKIS